MEGYTQVTIEKLIDLRVGDMIGDVAYSGYDATSKDYPYRFRMLHPTDTQSPECGFGDADAWILLATHRNRIERPVPAESVMVHFETTIREGGPHEAHWFRHTNLDKFVHGQPVYVTVSDKPHTVLLEKVKL